MEIRQNLRQTQQQSLVMTPHLQQAIKLLQLNHIELVEQIQQEILENPTLEEVPGTGQEPQREAELLLGNQANAVNQDTTEARNGDMDADDWASRLDDYSDKNFRERGGSGMEELPPIETNLTTAEGLAEHLEWQLQMQHCTDNEREAAHVIIRSLDDRGWLNVPLSDLIAENGWDTEDAEGALLLVQQLDPIGCGAKDLQDCLKIQIRALYPEDPYFPKLVQDHLPDIEKRNYAAIAKKLGIDMEDVVEYHRMLKTLEPWPGRAYNKAEPQYISPDVYVYKVGDEWQVLQNEDGLPKLRISNYYRNVLTGKDSTREERDYIKDRLNSADFLLKAIYKRQDTIGKVMRAILKRQIQFFEKGPDQLKPMVLRDIADEIDVHESTVSRVTSSKYVQCPQGIFELKYFFNNGVNAVHGEQVSAEAVKQRIRRLVQAEDRANPYSDEQIVTLLTKENINIARRTVAKYREALGILPGPKRKQLS